MIDLKRYNELKNRVAELEREANRAEGALAQVMEKLSEEFECKSLKQADRLVAKLEKEAKEAEDEYDEAMKQFEKQWDDRLNGEEE